LGEEEEEEEEENDGEEEKEEEPDSEPYRLVTCYLVFTCLIDPGGHFLDCSKLQK